MTDFELRQDVDAVTNQFHSDPEYVLRRQEIVRRLSASVKVAQTAFLAAEDTSGTTRKGPLPPTPPV